MSEHDFSNELHRRLAAEDARERAIQDGIDQRKRLEEAKATREQEEQQQGLLREAELLFAPETWRELLVEPRYDSYHHRAILRCSFLESAWYLYKDVKANTWELSGPYGGAADKAIPPESLEQKLLLQLARYRRSEAQRQQAIKDVEQKRLAGQAARLAVHGQLEARLISEQERLKASLFAWPEDLRQVYVYQISYCKGGGWNGSQRATTFEYEKAYTTTDVLDADGYIEMHNEKDGPQTIKLDPKIHKPIWRRIIIAKTTDAPSVLYEPVEATLPNVVNEYNQEDQRYYLIEGGRQYHLERRHVGKQPVLWLRQHILAQATEQRGESTHA